MSNESMLTIQEILDSISHLYPNLSFKFCTSSYEWIVDSVSFNTPFCTLVHSNRKLSAKCSVCDHRGMEIAMSSLRPLCYKCHMGITEFVFPVVKNDQSLGVFFAGQFLTEAPLAVGYQALKSTCNEQKMDYQKMEQAFEQLCILPEPSLMDFSVIFQLCEYYIINHTHILLDDKSTVKRVDDYLNQHLEEHLTLEGIAQQVNLSPTYLSTIYKKRTQMSLFKSIQKKRISFACYLLRNSAKNISEISLEVGLNDQNYFTRLFKEFMHVTPRYYREHWEEIERGRNLQIYFLPDR